MTATPHSVPSQHGRADVLRPEARPLPYGRLDEQQQVALSRVVGLLTATTANADQATIATRDHAGRNMATMSAPYLEATRSSRNILVSGERGTGKTTLLLSLAEMLATNVEPDTTPDDTLPSELANQIRNLRRRFVWLETLDMEPIASEANLLGAVLARVEDAVGARLPSMDPGAETAYLLHPGAGFHNVSRELGRLQTSVALTFGGNLVERAGSLDPDTFAVESRRAERERLGLDRRFASVLAGLSSALAGTLELTAPVFVLPVDDLDLNVGDCVPMLRLLRAAAPPHLVVILAADLRLLSTILRLWYQGELAKISRPVALNSEDERMAVDLAANALRKHLPPAQRVVLALVEPTRALGLRPLGPGTPSLSQVLGPVDLPSDAARLQVASEGFGLILDDAASAPLLSSPGWPATSQEDAAQLAERLAPFSWLQVLRLPMRSLVDLYLDCIVPTVQTQARPPLAHEVGGSPLVRLAVSRSQGERPEDAPGFRVSAWFGERPPAPAGQAPVVRDLPWHGWRAYFAYAQLEMAEAASLIGCAELLGDRWSESAYGPSRPTAEMRSVRATRWPVGTAGGERWVDWPWVTHSTFWGYERALAWLAEADRAWATQADAAFGSWVAVMTAQLFDAPGASQSFDRPTRPLATNWASLAERLAKLDETERTPRVGAWLEAVGLLCTPEMGMTALVDIPALLPTGWIDRVQRLRNERASSFPASLREITESWPAATAPPDEDQPKTVPEENAEDEEEDQPKTVPEENAEDEEEDTALHGDDPASEETQTGRPTPRTAPRRRRSPPSTPGRGQA